KAIKAAEARLADTDKEEAQRLAVEQAASERAHFEQKVNKMVDQAVALHETGQYEEAIALANKTLELDPTNPEAHSIISTARDHEHDAKRKFLDNEYLKQLAIDGKKAEHFNIP